MANETATPPSPIAPVTPVVPVVPAKTATPPIPAAQEASRPKSATPPPAAAPVVTPPKPDNSLEANLKKVAAEVFGSQEAKDALANAKPVEPEVAKPVVPAAEVKKADAPAAPVADTKDRFSDIAPPDGATEVTQKGWKALKDKANRQLAAAETKYAEAQAQIETYRKATPAEAADLVKLQTELKAAHDRLAVLDVSAHPDFHKQYVEPQKKALAEADQLVKDYVEGAPNAASLLSLSRKEFAAKVSELSKDMPAFDQSTFVTNMREAYRLQGEQKDALAKAGELNQQLQAQSAQRQKAAFEDTFKEIDERMKPLEVPDGADDDEKASIAAYNTGLSGLRAEAEKNAFGRMDDRGVARLAAKAATLDFIAHNTLPRMNARYESAVKLIAELTAELSAIKQAKSPGTFSGDAAPAPKDMSKGTFHDAMQEAQRMAAEGR